MIDMTNEAARYEPDDIEEWLLSGAETVERDDYVGEPILSLATDVPPQETKSLRFRTAREISESTSEDVEFAAAYLAFGAITELDGKPKTAGKTTFVLAMVRAILEGLPFLGRPTVQGPVVMLTEQPPSSLRAALVRAGLTEHDDFILLSWADAAASAWPEIVAAAAEKCRGLGGRVLIVDTLPQFAGLRGDAENNAGDALQAVEPLQMLAAAGFAILVSRHDRKAGGEVGESARGSGAFTGAVDIVLGLARNSSDRKPTVRRLACLSRFTETPPDLLIELIEGDYVVIGTSAEALAEAQRERLLGCLAESDEPMRVQDIEHRLDDLGRDARQLLKELLADGLVVRTGAGKRGDPYLWSAADGDGGSLSFRPPTGDSRKERNRAVSPGSFQDELAVADDYSPCAYDTTED